jgi:hypothetical protein
MSKVKDSKFAQSCIFDRPVNNFSVGNTNDIIIIIIICYKEAKDKTRIFLCNVRTYYTTSPDITSHNVSSTLILFHGFTLSSFSLCDLSSFFRDRDLCF